MYNIGEFVIYGSQGVCKVEGIEVPNIPELKNEKLYYVLSPVNVDGRILTPVDTSVFIRPVMTNSEAENVITQIPDIKPEVFEDRNCRVIEEHYKKYLSTHDCLDLVYLLKSVSVKGKMIKMQGKKLGSIDEKYRKAAEELLYSELSVALNIDKSDVEGYIAKSIEKMKSAEKAV